MIARLSLPDLSLNEKHPLVENGTPELPAAHDGALLIVTDNWYYIAIDTDRMAIVWKRLIDANDATREPPMRFYLKGDFFAALKENFDQKALYMLSSKTGEVLWNTDPKNAKSPQPMDSILFSGDNAYGILPHAGQGFYFVGLDAKTGKRLFTCRKQRVIRKTDGEFISVHLPEIKSWRKFWTIRISSCARMISKTARKY